jgi:hypothetical protein
MLDRRWAVVVAGIILCNGPGVTFVFSVYSGALKKKFNLSQGTLQLVGLSGQASQPFSWVWGMVNDAFGPRFAVTLAGVFMSGSYLVQWLVVQTDTFGNMSTNSTMIVISLCAICYNFGSDLVIAAVFATNVRNFSAADESGSVTGLLKCALGLCGAIITQMYTGFVGTPTDAPSTLNFLLFESIFLACCTFLPAPFIQVLDKSLDQPQHQCSKRGFKHRMQNGYTVFSLVALCCFISSMLETSDLSTSALKRALLPLACCILLFYLFLVPTILFPASFSFSSKRNQDEETQEKPLLMGDDQQISSNSLSAKTGSKLDAGENDTYGIELPGRQLPYTSSLRSSTPRFASLIPPLCPLLPSLDRAAST